MTLNYLVERIGNIVLNIALISTSILVMVNCAIRFKVSPCEDGTKKVVTFAIADWLYNHRIDSVRAKSDLWNKFEIEFYRPMVSELTKYENEDCFKTTLVALYKGSAVVLDGNERETNAIGRSLPSYIYTSADWAYTSHWIDEYAKQTTKKSRILV